MRHFHFRSAALAVAGTSHQREGRPCGDFADYRSDRKQQVLLALADGAGSTPHGHDGARCAVAAALDAWRHPDLLQVAAHARDAVGRAADLLGVDVSEFHTTLLLARIVRRKRGLDLDVVQIGDGVVVAGSRTSAEAVTEPYRGEFANQTCFLTSREWSSRVEKQRRRLAIDDGVMLMSDGPMSALRDARSGAISPAVSDIFGWAHEVSSRRLTEALDRAAAEVLATVSADDLSLACTVGVVG